jgi:hypothetical protein
MRTEKRCWQFRLKSAVMDGTNRSIGRSGPILLAILWRLSGDPWWASGAMTKAEDYRRYAAECLRLAQQPSRGQAEVALLLEMAERCRQLAEQARSRSEQADDSC